jgi:hypothetical protein
MEIDKCDCGATTQTRFADIRMFTALGPSGSAFNTGEVEIDVCPKCGKSAFVIPTEIRQRFLR